MHSTYIVCKPFKSKGKYYPVGSVITDPSGIRYVKSKLQDGKIRILNSMSVRTITVQVQRRTGKDMMEDLCKMLGMTVEEFEVHEKELQVTPVKARVAIQPVVLKEGDDDEHVNSLSDGDDSNDTDDTDSDDADSDESESNDTPDESADDSKEPEASEPVVIKLGK